MITPRNPESPRTASELTTELERQIGDGVLAAGTRLDPVRAKAQALGLAPNTVATAYRQLQARGLVYGDGRRGTFVAEHGRRPAPGEHVATSGLIDLATGNPDLSLLPDLQAAIGRAAVGHLAYGSPPIDERLAEALAADLGADLAHLGTETLEPGTSLAVVSGALDGIERTLAAHLRPGDRVAIEDPAYVSVLDLLSAMNLRPAPVLVDERGLIPDALERVLRQGVAALVLTPRAQNPTGAAIDPQRAGELTAVLAEHPGLLVVEDDHAGAVSGVAYHGVIPEHARSWVVIRSVAKSLGPDLRLAGLVGDPTTVGRVVNRQMVGTGWVSHILQRTVAELLTDPAIPPALEAAAETYRTRRASFIALLAEAGIEAWGRSGMNVWVPVDDEAETVAGMQRAGFAIRSGARFRTAAAPAVRISTAGADRPTLVRAADALETVLAGPGRTRMV